MATEDKLTKKEFGADIATGLGGAILGAVMSPMMARTAGVGITRTIGESLMKNKEALSAPFFSKFSKEDERQAIGIELKMNNLKREHNGVPFKDILTLFYVALGPHATDRFRSISIGIPMPSGKKDKKKITKKTGEVEETESEAPTDENPRVQFLIDTIEDIIRFGKPGVDQTQPDFTAGIEQVLRNLKVRNVADANSLTAKVSRWWADKPLEDGTELAKAAACKWLGVESYNDITPEMVEAKLKGYVPIIPPPKAKPPATKLGGVINWLLGG